MTPRRRNYAVLAALFSMAILCAIGSSVAIINDLRFGTTRPRQPMQFGFRMRAISGLEPEAQDAGIHWGDVLEEVSGHAFTGENVLRREISNLHAGYSLPVVVRQPGGNLFRASIALRPERDAPPTVTEWLIAVAIKIVLPVLCLALGFWVAGVRPLDPLAWLLLALLISFGALTLNSWEWPGRAAFVAWFTAAASSWPIWMLLFGIYFPERAPLDRQYPWLKWLVIVPLILWIILLVAFVVGSGDRFDAVVWLGPILIPYFTLEKILGMAAVGSFFALLGQKSGTASTPDGRRRLGILWVGASVSLTPSFVVFLISLVRDTDPFVGLPGWVAVLSLLALALFPLVLAYVIVIQKAMDVRVVIRQGLQYGLARGGIRVLQVIVTVGVVSTAATLAVDPHRGRPQKITLTALGVVGVLSMRKVGERLRVWTDRRFFRDAYNAEQILSDLGDQVRSIMETHALLETVSQKISESLHVPRVAVLLHGSAPYRPAYAIGYNSVPEVVFFDGEATVSRLRQQKEPALVYFDDPDSWIYRAPESSEEERAKLAQLKSELLLPLAVKEELLGFISLGQKRSEEPYTSTDLRLLKSVATQTGLALENARLTAAIAEEVGQRERMNREIEIAREVQERLFPQKLPTIPGLDYFGACRPALGVGGDYYDFLALPGGRLGIAIGDVSGKGIAAALMMASLQASLRSESMRAPDDLAQLISNVNRLVYEASSANRYATFFYAQYDPATQCLSYVNAGHNPPMVFSQSGGQWQLRRLDVGGVVVGLLERFPFQQGSVNLKGGDILVAYTDGVSEAMNHAHEEWGENRLIEAIQGCDGRSSAEMITRIMKGADAFASGAPQHDDMTLVVMRVLGAPVDSDSPRTT